MNGPPWASAVPMAGRPRAVTRRPAPQWFRERPGGTVRPAGRVHPAPGRKTTGRSAAALPSRGRPPRSRARTWGGRSGPAASGASGPSAPGKVAAAAERYRWARQVALQTQLEDCALLASDVVRLALERLRASDAASLRQALVDQAWRDLQRYPGRAKRGMPTRTSFRD